MIAAPGSTLRWLAPENLHVTLCFLGSVDGSRVNAIAERLADIGGARLRITLDGFDVFANAGAVIVRAKRSAPLLTLAEQVTVAMENCGFPREKRPYQPHVTLARQKGRGPLRLSPSGFSQSFSAREFRLYESHTRPEGAQYEVVQAFPLRQASGQPYST